MSDFDNTYKNVSPETIRKRKAKAQETAEQRKARLNRESERKRQKRAQESENKREERLASLPYRLFVVFDDTLQ
uniref:STPR domain-containing protein n=1 Tax=Rhizophagus irregularis (strain DAOM 181602 / DAOM 197198 / MUCL 43194) TaxID=747089 RepID=U9U8G3_RHIID